MRGLSITALAAAIWLVCGFVLYLPVSAMEPGAEAAVTWGQRSVVLEADGGRDIIRLLPPPTGGGANSQTPAMPDLPFPPADTGGAPGQGARLTGRTIEVPIRFEPWPGYETLSYIGVRFDSVTDPMLAFTLGLRRHTGVFVTETTPGGPAALAGLRFGDFVTAIDGTPVTETSQLIQEIEARQPGTDGMLTVWRVGDDASAYLSELRHLAEGGSTPAMLFLGKLYSTGAGVPRDATEALTWYRTAALAGSTNGMLFYGDALAGGAPIKDVVEAERWIRKAADAGNVAAVYRLGRMYRDGEGRPRDPLEALNLFKQAAEANYTPAMVAVGLMLEGGSGIEADHLQAVRWYKRAADAGDPDGMAALGTMYSTGR
ncbi:MAG TPA: PDZ domain-containing protein, partial [Hyphomicrobium sp.]|nr:PDZ domain-containing protein [Hyphomicrobium sp.]